MRRKNLRMGLAWGLMSILISALCLVSIRPAPVFALSLDDYFSYSFDVEFSETDIRGYEIFYVTVEGTATCKEDLPLAVSEARITGRIIAEHQDSGAKVTLNSSYSVTIEDFPFEAGETSQASTVVSLRFPWKSKAGIYDVAGELIEAEVKVLGVWIDVTSYLPSSQTLGSITYVEHVSGGGGIKRDKIVAPEVSLLGWVDEEGVFTNEVTIKSGDGKCWITIDEGTTGLTEDGDPLGEISIVEIEEPPPLPEDFPATIIGLAYDFGPDRATFDSPVTLTFTYDPNDLPEGVDEGDLVIAYYDEDAGEWVELDTTVDPVTRTITADIDSFTIFAIMAPVPAAPPLAPALEPAAFTSSSLSISPLEVDTGETVTISVLMTNTGEEAGSYTIILKINGVVEETKEITLAGDVSKAVSFTTSRDKTGNYSVDVDGLAGSFTVKEVALPPAPPPVPPEAKPNWWLASGIIAGMIIIGVYAWWATTRQRA